MVEYSGRRRQSEESLTDGYENIHEEKHRLLETRIAQVGALLLVITRRFRDTDLGKLGR